MPLVSLVVSEELISPIPVGSYGGLHEISDNRNRKKTKPLCLHHKFEVDC